MMPQPITLRRLEVLEAYAKLEGELGRPPLMREVSAEIDASSPLAINQTVYDLVRLGFLRMGARGRGGHVYTVAPGKLAEARRLGEEILVRAHPLVKVHRAALRLLAKGTPATGEEVAAEVGIGISAAWRYLRVLRLVGAMPGHPEIGRNHRATERKRAAKIRREKIEAATGRVVDLPGQRRMPWGEARS